MKNCFQKFWTEKEECRLNLNFGKKLFMIL